MNKELEETKIQIKEMIQNIQDSLDLDYLNDEQAIETCKKQKTSLETVLNYIDNSISKEVVENYLKDEKEKFEVYKKESENNENLKGQMWHHMGAKNMCERILGIEKLVTLD